MKKEEILLKINDIFKDAFDDELLSINYTTTSADVEGWDSLRQIQLIEMIEDEFNMRFKMEEITSMANVGEMIDIIIERI